MITQASKSTVRWIAPAAAAGLVIAGPAFLTGVAQAEPALPPKSADDIIAEVLAAYPVAFTGEVSQQMNLGLPEMPGQSGVDLSSPDALWSLVSGTNTWRLWYDGDRSYRVAIIRGQSESDLISNGSVVWAWSSQSQTAVRTQIESTSPDPRPVPTSSPQQAAQELLRELEQDSSVSTDANVRVAGRPAYEVVVIPSQPGTRVAQARIAVDAETALPLRLQIFSTTSQAPAVEIGFTKVNFTTPNSSVFEFTPPPGAEIIEHAQDSSYPLPEPTRDDNTGAPSGLPHAAESSAEVVETAGLEPAGHGDHVTIGEGWAQVTVTAPISQVADPSATTAPLENSLTELLPKVSGDWGSGVVLDGTLISVVIADDGRMAFGAVAPETLYQALAR